MHHVLASVLHVGFMAKFIVVFGRYLIKVITETLAALYEVSHSFQRSSTHKPIQHIYYSRHIGVCCRLLLSQVLLLRSKDMDITGLHILCRTCNWVQHYCWQVTNDQANSSYSVIFISLDLKKHLVDKWFVTQTWRKLFFSPHIHTVHLDNYQRFFTNWCTIG